MSRKPSQPSVDDGMNQDTSGPSPEVFFERGRTAREQKDASQWELGKICADYVVAMCGPITRSHYRANEIQPLVDEFAREVGIGKITMREYYRLHTFYEKNARALFQAAHPNVFYTHFRQARKLRYRDRAWQWLEIVSAEGFTVDEAAVQLDKWMESHGWKVEKPDEPPDDAPPDEPLLVADKLKVLVRDGSLRKIGPHWVITLTLLEADFLVEHLRDQLPAEQVLECSLRIRSS